MEMWITLLTTCQSMRFQSMVESPDKKSIAVGTTHGCYRIDKRNLRVSRFFYPSEFPTFDYNFFVNAMAFQDARHIWIATDGGGLYLYDWQKHQLKNYTTSEVFAFQHRLCPWSRLQLARFG